MRVGLQIVWQKFEGDLALELRVLGQEHLAHAASTQALEDAVPGRGLAHARRSLAQPTPRDRAESHAATDPRMAASWGSGAVESAIRRVINLRIKGASIYWLPESVDAILLLRSFYKSSRWNCLQRMAMTPVGVSA